MALQLVWMTRITSATWDEPHHLLDGYTVWTRHDYRFNPEVPPLVKLVAALPLLPKHLQVPADQGRSEPKEAFLDGRSFVFSNGGDRVLAPARLAAMTFTLALGLLIYLAAADMFSPLAGLVALALYVFDPNFIAHGALVTTDAGSACLFLAAVYTFYRYTSRPSWQRLLLTGLAAGLLLATKFTGILIAPMLLLAVLLLWCFDRDRRALLRRLGSLALVALCAWALLWAFYGFRYKAAPSGLELQTPLAQYIAGMHHQADALRLTFLARHHLLPEGYLWGLVNTKETEFADNSYFLGRVLRHGDWKYFPAAFLIKSTLPLLLLLCLAAFALPQWRDRRKAASLVFLLTPIVVYFAVVMHSHFDIGLRHLLPVYPLLYVVAGGAASVLMTRTTWRYAIAALLLWQTATTLRAAPAWMAYGNETIGGPAQVHRYLSDSNTDWGQQLKAVKAYLDAHPDPNCWFVYFPDGAIEPDDYGVHCHRLPTTSAVWWLDLPGDVPPRIEGTVLISDGNLQGIEFGDGPLNPFDSFRGLKPDAVIQGGVYVYHGAFDVPLASALVEAHQADKLLTAGQPAQALVLAQHASALAPASAPVLTTLGDAWLANGDSDAAIRTYKVALQSALEVRRDLQEGNIDDLRSKLAKLSGIR